MDAELTMPWDTPTATPTPAHAAAEPLVESLRVQVVKLAALREEVAQREAAIKAKRDALEAKLADELRTLARVREERDATDEAVRAMALVEYNTTKTKKPCAGVEVKVSTSYAYNKADAWAWAQKTGLCVTPAQLDVKAFETLVKSKATTLDFVSATEEPKVQIATNLPAAFDKGA